MTLTPVDLIDQFLSKNDPVISLTEKQLKFLRELVLESQNPDAMQWNENVRHKKLIAALKREVTSTKKAYEAAVQNLKEEQSRKPKKLLT